MDIDRLSDDARELLAAVLNDEGASQILYHSMTRRDVEKAVHYVDEDQREHFSFNDIRDVADFLYSHLENLQDDNFDVSDWMNESAEPLAPRDNYRRYPKKQKKPLPAATKPRTKDLKRVRKKDTQLTERNQVNATKRRRYQSAMGDHVLRAPSGDTIHSGSGRAKQQFRRAANATVNNSDHDGASDAKRNLSRAWLGSKKGTQMQRGNGSYSKLDRKIRGVREGVEPLEERNKVNASKKRAWLNVTGTHASNTAKNAPSYKRNREAADSYVRGATKPNQHMTTSSIEGKHSKFFGSGVTQRRAALKTSRGKHLATGKGSFAHMDRKARQKAPIKVRESVENLIEKSLWKRIKRAIQSHSANSAAGILNHHKNINFANKDRATYTQAKRAARFSRDLGDRAANLEYKHGQEHHRQYLAKSKERERQKRAERKAPRSNTSTKSGSNNRPPRTHWSK